MASLITGCANFGSVLLELPPTNWGREVGYVWCNERYLDLVDGYGVGKAHRLARKGYPYALASALVLQKDNKIGRKHWFNAPPQSLIPMPVPGHDGNEKDPSGFYAATFRRPAHQGSPETLVIAFRGTDGWRDWWFQNLAIKPEQFEKAVAYVRQIASEHPGDKIVATGHSLGGGLAIHVRRSLPELVSEAWVFNTSPRTGVPNEPIDPNIYFIASRRDGLKAIRPDAGYLGAPIENSSTDFDLIQASSFYTHSRWVITREVLHFADYAIYMEPDEYSTDPTEPLEILRASSFDGCKPPYLERVKERRAAKKSARPAAINAVGPRPD